MTLARPVATTAGFGEPELTLPAMLDLRAAQAPDRTAFIWDDIPETFGQFRAEVRGVGAGLLRLGLRPADRFAIYLGNCPEYAHAWMAGIYTGVQPVSINLAYFGEFLRHQLVDSGSRVVVTSAELLGNVLRVLPECPDVAAVVVLGAHAAQDAPVPLVAFADLRGPAPEESPASRVELCDPGAIIYTSGTTGQSKGVQLSQGTLAYVAKTNTAHMGLRADDVAHISAPLYHVSGINGISHTVWAGCATVFERRFSVTAILGRLRRHRVTAMTVVGPMLQMLWNRPWSDEEQHLSLRLIYAGSALPAPFELLRERYGIEYLCCAYGQTEVQTSIVGRLPGLPAGAVGKPMPTLEVRLVDDGGRDVACGEAGELIVRPKVRYAIFDGYYNNPVASERATVDGWYHSGDVLRQDEEGHFYLVDRKKDVVRRRGENISSIELETAISAHDDIAEVAIHSVPSELGEDEVKAAVVLRPGSALGHREFHEYCSSILPRFAVPRYVEFLDELPKNPLGRIQKFVLRERGVTPDTWDQQTVDTAPPSDPAGRPVG